MVLCNRLDIAVHWRDSFACEFVTDQLKIGWVRTGDDCLFKMGGLVVIVSKFDKTHQRS